LVWQPDNNIQAVLLLTAIQLLQIARNLLTTILFCRIVFRE
jgi:hypothetical protein